MPPPEPTTDRITQLLEAAPFIWRGGDAHRPVTRSTGFRSLDALLPGEGWPVGALTEVIPVCEGLGELSLCLPALSLLCREGRYVAFVAPPHIPYAPALRQAGIPLEFVVWIDAHRDEDVQWSAEQLLREGQAGAVLVWTVTRDEHALRRLQLAAESGKAIALAYRPAFSLRQPSPAAIRIALQPACGDDLRGGTRVELIKARGGRPGNVTLPLVKTFG